MTGWNEQPGARPAERIADRSRLLHANEVTGHEPERTGPLTIAVLVKQVPVADHLSLLDNGRLDRTLDMLEMNAYCRRAVAQGVSLAQSSGGTCTVFTMGPPQAMSVLREAVAWGADWGILVSDAALAGSDTLATSRALSCALGLGEPWDLILVGKNSIDADTGQVGPQVAELLDLPFCTAVRDISLVERTLTARCETDSGHRTVELDLPAVLSVAERLIEPCKMSAEAQSEVDGTRIRSISVAELGPGPWGVEASRTEVGRVREQSILRRRSLTSGGVARQIASAGAVLEQLGLDMMLAGSPVDTARPQPGNAVRPGQPLASTGPIVAVLVEQADARVTRELLGEAAELAERVDGTVVALGADLNRLEPWFEWGADHIVSILATEVASDVADIVGEWCQTAHPWSLLVPGTLWGREVASRVAVKLDAGLTGDAVALETEDDRLICWKPAFSGRLLASITTTSPPQLATVRPGVLDLRVPRASVDRHLDVTYITGRSRRRLRVIGEDRSEEADNLKSAPIVIGLGLGVDPESYPQIAALARRIGAEIGATRKVTDRGWLPHSRQIGITGHSLAPRLYIGVGTSGRFNHAAGIGNAAIVVMVNIDRHAPAFDVADVGMIGDWKDLLPPLVQLITQMTLSAPVGATTSRPWSDTAQT